MILTTSSMLSTASRRPSRMCSRSFAAARSKRLRLTTTLCRWSMKCTSISRSAMTFGTPSTSARKITPKVDCICVCL